ncbi:cupin domain-containing protein [Desulfogranum marinum]|uniref:cupin domain-containing protein n=1 Tax=Desulfogranum marinum TaxID=453220 RepID=UPI00196444FA|nr:cupin domain-containing protein [Desulfogranum marinum]MBM9515200.1 cupin domain-containing protein [Desulfogranum marinum]
MHIVRNINAFKTISSFFLVLTIVSIPFFAHAGEPAVSYTWEDKELQWGPCPSFIPKGCEIAVLHGTPTENNTDIFFKVPGNFEIPHHWHTSPERMVLVSGTLEVTYDNQATETLKPGTYAYGPARLPHTAFCQAGAPCVLMIAFEDPVDAFEVVKPAK